MFLFIILQYFILCVAVPTMSICVSLYKVEDMLSAPLCGPYQYHCINSILLIWFNMTSPRLIMVPVVITIRYQVLLTGTVIRLCYAAKHSKPVCRHSAAATCLQSRLGQSGSGDGETRSWFVIVLKDSCNKYIISESNIFCVNKECHWQRLLLYHIWPKVGPSYFWPWRSC